ncbi:MAG: hypothetical protein K8R67_12405 [Desulfobacteraceae bacterium]|nr:hypothetical protein [Desulfobacteraceae bacterium]
MAETRSKVRAIILGMIGIIAAILVFRIALDLIEASTSNVFVNIIHWVSNIFIFPFENIISLPNNMLMLNVDAITALVIIVLAGIAISEIVTAFLYDNFEDIIQNVIDGIFKVIEFFLVLRILFVFFQVEYNGGSTSAFVKAVYDLTAWTQGLIQNPFDIFGSFLDVSALIVLVIVVIIDIVTESFLNGLFRRITASYRERVGPRKVVKKTTMTTTTQPIPQASIPMPAQNIVVNVPVPVVQPVRQSTPIVNQQPQIQSQPRVQQPIPTQQHIKVNIPAVPPQNMPTVQQPVHPPSMTPTQKLRPQQPRSQQPVPILP